MIKSIKSDIFAVKCDAIIHQANCFHTMGSGIAKFIRESFPEAYAADCKTEKGDPKKLGTFSWAKVENKQFPSIGHIINLYSQFDFSAEKKCTSYDAMHEGLTAIRDKVSAKNQDKKITLAIPMRMGCNRGGGDWEVVKAIIQSVFGEYENFTILICENPALQENLQNKVSK